MRLASQSETAILSTESVRGDEEAKTLSGWVSSVRPAYYSGQLVAVKDIRKPSITLTKTIITEVNQV